MTVQLSIGVLLWVTWVPIALAAGSAISAPKTLLQSSRRTGTNLKPKTFAAFGRVTQGKKAMRPETVMKGQAVRFADTVRPRTVCDNFWRLPCSDMRSFSARGECGTACNSLHRVSHVVEWPR